VVRVISNMGKGGFVPDKLYALIIDNDTIDLSGEWKMKQGAKMQPLAGQTFVRWEPVGLHNAMVAPVTPYRIKGFCGIKEKRMPTNLTNIVCCFRNSLKLES